MARVVCFGFGFCFSFFMRAGDRSFLFLPSLLLLLLLVCLFVCFCECVLSHFFASFGVVSQVAIVCRRRRRRLRCIDCVVFDRVRRGMWRLFVVDLDVILSFSFVVFGSSSQVVRSGREESEREERVALSSSW